MTGLAVLCFAYVLSQLYRSFMAVLAPILATELGMDTSQLAMASGAWFVMFALAQFPVGYWLDTIGPRRTAGLMFTIAGGGGAILFALASSPIMVIVAMGLIGIGCAPVLMAPFYIFARTFSVKKFASYGSIFIGIGTFGNIFGSEPLATAATMYGWRPVMFAIAAATILSGITALMIVRDPEQVDHSTSNDGESGGFLAVLKIRRLWPIFPLSLFGYAVAAGIRGLWAGPYLEQVFSLDVLEIGRVTLFMAIAQSVGVFMYGPLDRIFNTRKWVVICGNFIPLCVCLYLAFNVPGSIFMVSLAFVLIGMFGATYPVQMAHGKSFVPDHLMGRGVTLLNFCSIGGVGLMQLVTGWVVENSSSADAPEAAFNSLFLVYAITLGGAIFILLFSKDAKPEHE
ncbi:MAG: MFS transporter [Rhizobiaceae bacterium]|nr:MFS transporter [Rhizobiaceae bacterium]